MDLVDGSLVFVQRHVLSQGCSWCLGLIGVHMDFFFWHTVLTQACLCFPPSHSTISSILGAWLDQYSEDFRKPPDFTCLKQLISYVHHNIPGSDLERRARILLAQFQQQEQSESEGEGGMLPSVSGAHFGLQVEKGLQVERVLLVGIEGFQNLGSLNPHKPCVYVEVQQEANPTELEVGFLNGLANLPLILCRCLCPGLR